MNIIRLKIEGMRCGSCANGIMQAVLQQFPSLKFSADHVAGTGLIAGQDFNQIKKCLDFIRRKGFQVSQESELRKKAGYKELIRLAVAFFCFANAMVLASAEYFAQPGELDENFISFFRAISASLATISLLYSGRPILVKAVQAVMQKKPSVDLSIGFALVCAYVFSLFSLWDTGIEPFFDSISATIFFILLGRLFQDKFIAAKTQQVDAIHQTTPAEVILLEGGSEKNINALLVKKNSTIKVFPGEIVPVNAQLLSDKARVSLDLINGESTPSELSQGSRVLSGSVVLEHPIIMLALENGQESRLNKIKWQAFRLSMQKSQVASFTDKLASIFFAVVVVLAVVCLFSSYYLMHNGANESISRMIAILLVACPCAFAVAVPMAMLRCAYESGRESILFKNAESIQRTALAKNIVFDKTGTLSQNKLTILEGETFEGFAGETAQGILYACEQSLHPVASALADYLTHLGVKSIQPCGLQDCGLKTKEVFGKGIELHRPNEEVIRIGNADFCGQMLSGQVENLNWDLFVSSGSSCAERILARFKVEEKDAPGLQTCMKGLGELNLHVSMLSGDNAYKVRRFAQRAGIRSFISDASPEQKLCSLGKKGHSIMVGNGFNDVMAISQANVGISVPGSSAAAYEVSDIHLQEADLSKIPRAIKFSRNTLNHIKQAFAFSAIYNSFAITLAFYGFLTPVAAAILMPINGIIVSLIASRRIQT